MYKEIDNKHAREEVLEAITNTERLLGRYFSTNLDTRTDTGIGSTYDGMSPEELRTALKAADWKEVEHADVMPGCRAYVTKDIAGGRFGLLNVRDLPDDTLFIAEDPKGTGRISIAAAGVPGPHANETFLIVGKDTDQPDPADREKPVVFTFHPGEPVRPSLVSTKDIQDGTVLTKDDVIKLGFDMAKVDRRAEWMIDSVSNEFVKKLADENLVFIPGAQHDGDNPVHSIKINDTASFGGPVENVSFMSAKGEILAEAKIERELIADTSGVYRHMVTGEAEITIPDNMKDRVEILLTEKEGEYRAASAHASITKEYEWKEKGKLISDTRIDNSEGPEGDIYAHLLDYDEDGKIKAEERTYSYQDDQYGQVVWYSKQTEYKDGHPVRECVYDSERNENSETQREYREDGTLKSRSSFMEDVNEKYGTYEVFSREGRQEALMRCRYDDDNCITSVTLAAGERTSEEDAMGVLLSGGGAEAAENAAVYETENVRVCISGNPITAFCFAPQDGGEAFKAVALLDPDTGIVTLSFADKNMREEAKNILDVSDCVEGAFGVIVSRGAAGTGGEMALALVDAAMGAEEKLCPPRSVEELKEMKEMRAEMAAGIAEELTARGFGTERDSIFEQLAK